MNRRMVGVVLISLAIFPVVSCKITPENVIEPSATQVVIPETEPFQTAIVEVTAMTDTPVSTATFELTVTTDSVATPTLEAISENAIPTPPFDTSQIADDFFFTPSENIDCQLPCWQELHVGDSNREDIQTMFEEIFGFDNTLDFFNTSYLETVKVGTFPIFEEVPGYYFTGYRWLFSPVGAGFNLVVWLSENEHYLQGIQFILFPDNNHRIHTPQEIIRTLGRPSHILISDPTDSIKVGYLDKTDARLLIIYDQGMVFYFDYITIPIPTIEGESENAYGELCLESSVVSSTESAYILKPFTDDINDLTVLQQALIGRKIEYHQMVPLDEVFATDLETITDLAIQQDDACIRTK